MTTTTDQYTELLETLAGTPVMVCPACQEYYVEIGQVAVMYPHGHTRVELLSVCPCGASWSYGVGGDEVES